MKVEIIKPSFVPVTVMLKFETQDELDKFGSLCNFAGLAQYGLPIWRDVRDAGADIGKYTGDIAKSLGVKI